MKIKELAIEFKNQTNNSNDLTTANENYQELKKEFTTILNQKNSNGNYIYSGTTNVQPFTDIYIYNGNQVMIDDKQSIEINIPGNLIVDSTLNQNFKDLDSLFNGSNKNISIDNLQSSINHISLSRTKLGGQINTLTNQQNLLENNNINSKNTIENIQGIDYAEEITNLNKSQVALQAMYKISSLINQINLFNFL